MRAIEAFESTMKRARALVKAHAKLRGRGRGKRSRFHSELLRATVVTSVSAMDAYFHDRIVENVRRTIRRTAPQFPDELLSFIAKDQKVDAAVRRFLQISMKKRPLAHVTTLVARKLDERAFQDPGRIEWGMKLIGVGDFWTRLAQELGMTPAKAKRFIMPYVRRRHLIVHRGDLGTAKKTKHQVRKITREFAERCMEDIDRFVHCAEAEIADSL